jgi:hypothetical protein
VSAGFSWSSRALGHQPARWLRLVRFRTVAEQEAFRSEVLAWLMKSYPEDFEGLEAEKPRQR